VSEQARDGARPRAWGPTELGRKDKDRIFFLASRGAVFQGLFQAVVHHFPGYDVSLVDHLPADEDPDEDVRLVLLSPARGWDFAACAQECHRQFPLAAIGLIVEDAADVRGDCKAVFDDGLAQGLLPLSLPLDVWLAVMSLLISGGEYFPVEMMRGTRNGHNGNPPGQYFPPLHLPEHRAAHSRPEQTTTPSRSVEDGMNGAAHTPAIGTLTARERQILKLVSEGYQNKLIADRMALSEHTVKAHVHNLIAKLRVSNRTQAAAAFLGGHETNASDDGRATDPAGRILHASRENGPHR
jgi:DNA-binding NarL/FixJ family response regulator